MRRILIFILPLLIAFIGTLFGDTIRYKVSFALKDTKENIVFLGVSNKKVYFKYLNDKIDYVSCKTVKEILDSDGNEIIFDCKSNGYIPPIKSSFFQSKEKNIQYEQKRIAHKIGGGLIVLGGMILYTNLDKECANCETSAVEDFLEDYEAQQWIGHAFIIMGGLIIAMGSS